MKKIIFSALFLFCSYAMVAQTIVFQTYKHDFGNIKQEDGDVTAYFDFKNEGTAPLVITNVRPQCGCTKPSWPKQPIEPGQTGTISAVYRSSSRTYSFHKEIYVTSNDPEHQSVTLTITGYVTPKPANPSEQYKEKMGDLSLKGKNLNFGVVQSNATVEKFIEYANFTDHAITVDVILPQEVEKYLTCSLTNMTLQPNESGKINFTLKPGLGLVGPNDIKAYVMVNSQVVRTDAYALNINWTMNEDFSALSDKELKEAPIAQMPTKVDMGTIVAGKSIKKSFTIANAGFNTLSVRRVYSPVPEVTATLPRTASIKSGKKMAIVINLTSSVNGQPQEAGQYSRQLSIYTNDPSKPKQNVTIVWNVQ